MNRLMPAAGLALLLLSCCAGCSVDDNARSLMTPYDGGKMDILMFGSILSGENMLKDKRIDLATTVEVPDKTKIDVWVIKARDAQGNPASAAGTVLVLHSWGQWKCSFPNLGVAERLAKRGYDVVLPDLRRHGRSTGDFITYGAKEKDDLKQVMDKLIGEKTVSDKVYVFGAGLGASAGILYAAMDPRVKCVAAFAPFRDFITYAHKKFPLMNEEEFQKVVQAAGKIGNFKPDEASTVEGARKLTCPLLVVHGAMDLFVPVEWGKAVAEAAGGPKTLVILGPLEVPLVAAVYEDWIADRVDKFIKEGPEAAKTQPSAQTKPAADTKPAPK